MPNCLIIVLISSFSGPYFPAIGLNRERYWTEYGPEKLQIRTFLTQFRFIARKLRS